MCRLALTLLSVVLFLGSPALASVVPLRLSGYSVSNLNFTNEQYIPLFNAQSYQQGA